jgi:hypothetical protein
MISLIYYQSPPWSDLLYPPFVKEVSYTLSQNQAMMMGFGFVATSAIIFSFLSASSAQQSWTVGQGVKTTSGHVVGMASAKNAGVSQYMGIPFAQPPQGANRWVKPLDFNTTDEIRAVKQAMYVKI